MSTIEERQDSAPTDPNWRYFGQRCDGPKNPEVALAARRAQFTSIEEFDAWRKSKGMPALSDAELAAAFMRFRGEVPGEKAVMKNTVEFR